MENVKRWHLLFEQSGTFKKQFQKLGLEAIDYARRFIRTYLKAYDAKDAEGEKNGKGEN